jgi:predicted transcriptional regulator
MVNNSKMEIIEETALAMAQATIQGAIDDAGLSRNELAKRLNQPKSFITRILTGRDLTICAFARILSVCNREIRFNLVALNKKEKKNG